MKHFKLTLFFYFLISLLSNFQLISQVNSGLQKPGQINSQPNSQPNSKTQSAAQTASQTAVPINITITGQVVDENNMNLTRVMVIDQFNGRGTFVGLDGKFSIVIPRKDTLMFAFTGYRTKKICFKDSVSNDQFFLLVKMSPLSYQLKEIVIYPVKKLSEIQRQIDALSKFKAPAYQTSGLSSVGSPITALYERFSRMEQSKRKVAELEQNDRKVAALKDLFRIYIKYDIIELTNDQFDDFITFCDLSDYYIIHASQFELVETIKAKYASFKELNDFVKHPGAH